MIAADSEGVIQWANPTAEGLFGYGPGELIGQPLANLIPTQYRTRHDAQLRHYFARPQTRAMGLGLDLAGLRKDGSVFPVEISLSYIAPPDGPLAVAFVTDITRRKRLENERDQFFELSPEPLCVVRRDGYFSQVNPALAARLGFVRDEMLTRPAMTFVHAEDQDKSTVMLGRLLAGEQVIDFENRLIAKDGSVRWFQWTAHAPAPGDEVFYAVARDVTAERETAEAQQRLVALIENITDFVGLASAEEPFRIVHINQAGRKMWDYRRSPNCST
jgi:PAS domain S-box-containing protein